MWEEAWLWVGEGQWGKLKGNFALLATDSTEELSNSWPLAVIAIYFFAPPQ